MSGARWRRWFFVFAAFAAAHDLGCLPAVTGPPPLEIAASAVAAPADEAAAGDANAADAAGDAAAAEHAGGGHADPVAPVLIGIALILLAAKLGGDFFERLHMPAVLGELAIGVLLGNLVFLTGWHGLDFLQPTTGPGSTLDILARIGVVLLLFEVGLESRISEMLSVGRSSLLVAVLGVVAPMLLGWGVSWMLIRPEGVGMFDVGDDWAAFLFPPGEWQIHAFIGATLCATSVGITARVLKDLGRSQQKESRIILGAAVIDDVLGLIVLAIVSGVIVQGEVSLPGLLKTVGLAFGFLAAALLLGMLNFPRTLFRAASYLRGHGLLVATALVICFGFAYAANWVGLAPIIGAFAAGLILEGAHYQEVGRRWENRSLEEALAPLSAVLVPIFFVEMGIQVKLESFLDPSVWMLAGGITVVAVIGKQICSLGVLEKGLNRTAVGLGMIPRGEVGLIFAAEGRRLIADGEPVISPQTYSAVVVMVMITTMVTPPLLKWSLGRRTTVPASPPLPPAQLSH
ncbi:MAG: cation:proton antiporter [Planctomycetales bacterium]